ncbi:MAG TPA: DotU family type IV/VI secretion system protein [Candidatus Sulfotelmatobacter sp.]|nr:DotU family type IV/VI secretion system protein [Candidatus Sulfotelmatobacter sp.]
MKLLELYEGLFQYICRLNRAAKGQTHPDYSRVRSEIKSLFDDISRSAASDPALSSQVKQLEAPMIFFVDNMIATSRLNFAPQWAMNRLAAERNELAGDERFFVDFLEKDLVNTHPEVAERLSVYYVCLGLGFTGMYQGQPEQIRRYLDQIFPRVRQWTDSEKSKITEQAYTCTDTRQLTEPPNDKISLLVVAFVFLVLCVFAICYGLYYKASSDLTDSVNQIVRQANP